VLLAPDGIVPGGHARLAVVCAVPSPGSSVVYLSDDGGATWTEQTGIGSAGAALIGMPQSLTDLTDGTLILATEGSTSSPGGIYRLKPGASSWQAATLSDPSQRSYGFTYVGMTNATQGVALGGNPGLHAIWMTTDGGQTWQVRPIKSLS
jgi:Neuraminidase (sialidase)